MQHQIFGKYITSRLISRCTAATHKDSFTDDMFGTLSVGFNYKRKNGSSFVGPINASLSNNDLTAHLRILVLTGLSKGESTCMQKTPLM